jgi:predicted exporter
MSSTSHSEILKYVDYEPGVCNIGPEEIARRRRAGHTGLIASIAVLALLLIVGAPAWTRVILFFTAGVSASGYLQAFFHFCAGFGSRGVYNFGELGTVQTVADETARSRDRRRSQEIGLASLAIGVVAAVIAVLLPIA